MELKLETESPLDLDNALHDENDDNWLAVVTSPSVKKVSESKGPCYMAANGECGRKDCPFSHDPTDLLEYCKQVIHSSPHFKTAILDSQRMPQS